MLMWWTEIKEIVIFSAFPIRNDDDFDDDDDAMGHGVCQIMMFVDGGGWGSRKTQNKETSFMNSALVVWRSIPDILTFWNMSQ